MYRKVKGAILYGILVTSLLAIITRVPVYAGPDGTLTAFSGFPNGILGLPVWPSDLVGQLDIGAALGLGLFSVVFTFFFVDFFDATGTLTGLAQRAGYLDEKGDMPRARLTFSMDGLAAMFGALVGTSTTTAYVESASGIEEGGRTGLTATTVGVLFGLSMFLWPLAGAVPGRRDRARPDPGRGADDGGRPGHRLGRHAEAVPAFLTIILMPLTFSIANGVSFGVISYCAIKPCSAARARKVSPILYVVAPSCWPATSSSREVDPPAPRQSPGAGRARLRFR